MRVLLYCQPGQSVFRHMDYLRENGLTPFHVPCLTTLVEKNAVSTLFHALFVDLATRAKTPDSAKTILRELEEGYPTMTLKCCADGQVVARAANPAKTGATIKAFLHHCTQLEPRSVRSKGRREVHLNVSYTPDNPVKVEMRSFTLNASDGGIFIATPKPLTPGTRLWVSISQLEDISPILAEVRWFRPWGKINEPPGVGVKFLDITPAQKGQLHRMIYSGAFRQVS